MITKTDLEKVAKLARLGISSEESTEMANEFEKIIKYFEQIRNLDLKNILPMTHAVNIILEPRADIIRSTKCATDFMPYLKYNYFSVPPVL
jgi:aspartyl/glutamyl-tRNA(Asn/Gln) amidotransferase C subunit